MSEPTKIEPAGWIHIDDSKISNLGSSQGLNIKFAYGVLVSADLVEQVKAVPSFIHVCRMPTTVDEMESFLTGWIAQASIADAVELLSRIDATHVKRMKQLPDPPVEDRVRVLRVVEYAGPRSLVEEQIKLSVHGTRQGIGTVRDAIMHPKHPDGPVLITAVTLDEFPEVLERAREIPTGEWRGTDEEYDANQGIARTPMHLHPSSTEESAKLRLTLADDAKCEEIGRMEQEESTDGTQSDR